MKARRTRLVPLGLYLAAALATAMGLASCRGQRQDGRGSTDMPKRPIQEVLQEHTDELMALPGVVGVYEGALEDGTPCIKVMIVRRTPELESRLPASLAGHPVVIEVSGEIRPMPGKPDGGRGG